jgi:hypothetical protein
MSEKQEGFMAIIGTALGLLSSIPSCIPVVGIWVFAFTFPALLLGILLLLASDASARYKSRVSLSLIFVPIVWQCFCLRYAR